MTLRLPKIEKTLSLRISMMVVLAIALLMTIALLVMLFYARRAVKKEALSKAEQTLATIVQKTDNVLLSVEQSAGNVYFDLLNHLDKPDMMSFYCRELVKANPYVVGCAIAFEPNYYASHDQYFMTYAHRTDNGQIVTDEAPDVMFETDSNLPYTEQIWYTKPVKANYPVWITAPILPDSKNEAIITFSLPLFDSHRQQLAGVMALDISQKLLTDIVLQAKPSPNSYATLIDKDGTFIIHPDSNKLFHKSALKSISTNPEDISAIEAAKAMTSGETGYKKFRLRGQDCYVFYKPFTQSTAPSRSMEKVGWSVGIIYPEDDIFGDYNNLTFYTLAIAAVGLILLLVLCYWFTRRQLKPLIMLTKSVQRISEGHYDEPIPESHQLDEVGRLQDHFQRMQQALAIHMGNLEQLTAQLQEQGEELRNAYDLAKEADRMKTDFLHNMSDKMITPVETIVDDVTSLSEHCHEEDIEKAGQLVNDIQKQGKVITDLLNDLLNASL